MDKQKKDKKKGSRAKYPLPDELEALINLVNLIPLSFKHSIPDLHALRRWEFKRLIEHGEGEYRSLHLEEDFRRRLERGDYVSKQVIKKHIGKLPKEFKDFIKTFSSVSTENPAADFETVIDLSSSDEIEKIEDEYKSFRLLRSTMLEFAKRIALEKTGTVSSSIWETDPIVLPVIPYRDSDGKLKKKGFGAIDFDPDRLRICAIESCRKLFWAVRTESKTCSAPCLNKYHVMKSKRI